MVVAEDQTEIHLESIMTWCGIKILWIHVITAFFMVLPYSYAEGMPCYLPQNSFPMNGLCEVHSSQQLYM
jgi:hypothetical protein